MFKKLKFLKVIKEKNVDVAKLKHIVELYSRTEHQVKAYNNQNEIPLTEKEINLFKKVFEL